VLRVLFFAAIRERLGQARIDLEAEPACATVDGLIDRLDNLLLPGCAAVLRADNTIVAVNREVLGRQAALSDGDEVAFYPPVTGG
jgi:sulfur-carrier protein